MKSFQIRVLCAALSLFGCAGAFAQDSKLYLEGGYSNIRMSMPSSTDSSPNMYRLAIGMNFHPNFAAEEMMAFNAKSDGITRSGVAGFAKMKTITGFYLKPKVDLADNKLTLFARIGYASYQANYTTSPYVETHGGKSFGLGISYKLTDSVSANLDHMSYFSRDGIKVKGTTVGVGYSF